MFVSYLFLYIKEKGYINKQVYDLYVYIYYVYLCVLYYLKIELILKLILSYYL